MNEFRHQFFSSALGFFLAFLFLQSSLLLTEIKILQLEEIDQERISFFLKTFKVKQALEEKDVDGENAEKESIEKESDLFHAHQVMGLFSPLSESEKSYLTEFVNKPNPGAYQNESPPPEG